MSIALTDISLSNFPEKISVKEMPGGEKVQIYFYGPKSYDNQLAVITHCLHGRDVAHDFSRREARRYLKEYLEYKFPEADIPEQVLSDPLQAGLFIPGQDHKPWMS